MKTVLTVAAFAALVLVLGGLLALLFVGMAALVDWVLP